MYGLVTDGITGIDMILDKTINREYGIKFFHTRGFVLEKKKTVLNILHVFNHVRIQQISLCIISTCTRLQLYKHHQNIANSRNAQ